MNKELAQTLTTALVQFIDREQPKDKMCVSSIEAEELERCFTEEKFNPVEDWCAHRMKSELTEFEEELVNFYNKRCMLPSDKDGTFNRHDCDELLHESAKKLLALANKELLSCHDESNPEIEAMADLEKTYYCSLADLERTYFCNPEKLPKWLKDDIARKELNAHTKGYNKGYKDASEEYNKCASYHFPTITVRPLCWEPGGTCTNPHMDCVNCPRKTTGGGYNTQFGTATAKAEE